MNISEPITVETAVAILNKLSPRERLKVIAQVLPETERQLSSGEPQPKKSLKGLWEGVSISAEEIDEARREMWSNFPREDI